MAKTTASAPGTTRRSIGASKHCTKGHSPGTGTFSCAARRNRSAGISCQPCRIKTGGQRQIEEHMRQNHAMQAINLQGVKPQYAKQRAARPSPARP